MRFAPGRIRAVFVAVALGVCGGAAAQAVDLVPNIEALPAFSIGLDSTGSRLLFSTETWNSGAGPLELRAGSGSSAGQNVYQRIYRSDGSFSDRLAGTFTFHPEHSHFHFDQYAEYRLQPAGAPGASDRISNKTTFCVMDTDLVDGSLPGAPSQPRYTSCSATVQGMSVGWGDTYVRTLAGQSIDVSGLAEGDYRLVIVADPRNRIVETNESDNSSCVLIHLRPASVTVLNPNSCELAAPVVVSSISPTSMRRGTSIGVTIRGSGFAPSMAVTFEGGSGQRPAVGNLAFTADGTMITATVTAKGGGGKSASVWDLRVGPTVLADAFTVLR
jgi:hypothetical protein